MAPATVAGGGASRGGGDGRLAAGAAVAELGRGGLSAGHVIEH